MTILIQKVGAGYIAKVAPPDAESVWETLIPMECNPLIHQLLTLGCHQTDIGDAFYEADPDWVKGVK